jgi:hypothetical protein
MQANNNEEGGLSKMILETMQAKIRDQDVMLEAIVK